MTIPKNTRKAKEAIAHATNIRCYSLSNGFSGAPLTESPVRWKDTGHSDGPIGHKTLEHVTQQEYLTWELNMRHAKLTGPLVHGTQGTYFIHIHSNLWYEFDSLL